MTLRARLVTALGALLVVGLMLFGYVTYSLYSRTQYQRLESSLRSSIPVVSRTLLNQAGIDDGGPGGNGGDGGQGRSPGGDAPAFDIPGGTYGELRDSTGKVLTQLLPTQTPDIPTNLPADNKVFTVGSKDGSTTWKAVTSRSFRPDGYLVVVAVPITAVTDTLHRLVLIEAIAGLALLLGLSSGSWLILRHGLRPLEKMAASARSINAGDLSQRVSPAEARGEVGQLGLALNSMLEEIERAFQEREATELKLRRFLADASHELRTPLTSIQGFAELFRLGVANDHVDQAVIMRRIEEESARMKNLVEDLLLLARLDQHRLPERGAVDLAVLCADACSDAAAVEPDRPLTLEAPDPVVVDANRDQMRQAIANLVTNALKHTPKGTPIEVEAAVRDGRAVVTVRDHGTGLTPEALEHAFDRFWQADQARVGTGAGLGLSIVAGIAESHGGTATATNDPAGGAVFTFELPVGHQAEARPTWATAQEGELARRTPAT